MKILNKQRAMTILLAMLFTTGAGATSISLFTLPEGNSILQVSDALAGVNGGGTATSEVRTIYFFAPDFGDPMVNVHDFSGSAWAYVYLFGSLDVDPGISATVTTANDGVGDFILINGNPVYQFINDMSATDANGNFGPWFFIQRDGSATQSAVVPVPAALPLLLSAMFATGWFKKRSVSLV